MTCWCKLLKGDLLIPLLLCNIQLYRTITIAPVSTDKQKAQEEIQEGERKIQAVVCWTSLSSEEQVGLWLGDSHTVGYVQIKGGCILLLSS